MVHDQATYPNGRVLTVVERKVLVRRLHAMRCRCSPGGPANYYGRGIRVCERWSVPKLGLLDFIAWSAMNGFEIDLQIDRRDNMQGYSPENCRWTTPSVNQRNKRTNRLLTAFGETKPAIAWLDDPRCVVGRTTLESRINVGNMTIEEAMTTPHQRQNTAMYTAFGEAKILAEWARDPRCYVSLKLLRQRVLADRWPFTSMLKNVLTKPSQMG